MQKGIAFMELIFLGCGGGRIIVDTQRLATGGFRINSKSLQMHVDPGPGALIYSLKYKQDPAKLDAIFVSHAHLDHSSDANLMIECMNLLRPNGKKDEFSKKRGTLLASRACIRGVPGHEKVVGKYFTDMLDGCRPLKAGEKYKFVKKPQKSGKTPAMEATLTATKSEHEDETAIGFVLEADGVKIGYMSDTQPFKGMGRQYDGCDYLIANCMRPDKDKLEYHMALEDLADAVNAMKKKPKAVFLTHAGLKMIRAGRDAQRRKFEKLTGVKAVTAQLGLKVRLDGLLGNQKKR